MTSNEFETHPIFEKVEQIIVRLSEQEIREKIDLEKLNFLIFQPFMGKSKNS